MAKMKLTGIRKIDKALRKIEPKLVKKGLNKTLREAQKKVMLKEAKSNTPVDEGAAKKALTVKAGKRKRHKVSLNTVFKTDQLENFYIRFIEFGAPEKGIEPRGFMRKSFESKKDEVKKYVESNIIEQVNKIVEKEAQKGGK